MKNRLHLGRNAFAFGCLLTPMLALSALAQSPTTPTASPANADAPRAEVQTPAEGFTLFNGKMYRIANGQAVPVTEDKTLRISSSGATDFVGQPLKIPAGSMLTVDGRVVPMPGGIRFTDGSAATTDPNPPPATPANAGAAADRASLPPLGGNPGSPDRGVTGENLSGLAPTTGNATSTSDAIQSQQNGRNMNSSGAATDGSNNRGSRSNTDRDRGATDPGLPVIIGPGTGVSGGIPGESAVNSGTATGSAVINPTATNAGATGTAPGARSTDFNSKTTNPNAVPARGSNTTQPASGGSTQTPGNPASNEINRSTPAAGQNTGTRASGTSTSGAGTSTSTRSTSGAGTGTSGTSGSGSTAR